MLKRHQYSHAIFTITTSSTGFSKRTIFKNRKAIQKSNTWRHAAQHHTQVGHQYRCTVRKWNTNIFRTCETGYYWKLFIIFLLFLKQESLSNWDLLVLFLNHAWLSKCVAVCFLYFVSAPTASESSTSTRRLDASRNGALIQCCHVWNDLFLQYLLQMLFLLFSIWVRLECRAVGKQRCLRTFN